MCSFEFKIPCSWTFLDFSLMHRLAEMKSLTQSPLNFCERYASRYFYSTLVELSLVSRLHRGGSTFCDGKITLPDGPTLLHINTLARPPGSSRKISENALCATAIGSGKGVIFSYKLSLKWTILPGTGFLLINRA